MEKYAMYLRKSRQDIEAEKLGDEETLARHKRILTELAARKNLFIDHIYQEVVSGDTIADRPEMKQMIQDCYNGLYKGIVIVEVTRLSRGNQGDAQIVLDCLKYSNNREGVLVITPTKTYDVAHSPDDERFMEFELFMSRQEYNMIKRRLDRGRKQAVVEGQYMGSYRPYGYDILKTRLGRTLTPNPEEAPIVKKIFEWTVNDNLTPGSIARKLHQMGVPTYRGDSNWNLSTIKTILTNPTYYGKVRWNDRVSVKKMVDGKIVHSRPRSNHTDLYMLHDGRHEPLVSEEMFIAASKRFYSDKTKADLKLKNPLAGLLVCKECQHPMVYQGYADKKNTDARYTHRQNTSGCNVKSVKCKDVLDAFTTALRLYIDDFETKVDNLPDVDENTILGQIEAIQKQIKSIENKISKLFDSWEDGIIDNNEFITRKEHHNKKIDDLNKQIEVLESSVPEKEEYEEMILMFSDALEFLKDESLDADIKNEYLKKFIKKIEFSREESDEFILDIYF